MRKRRALIFSDEVIIAYLFKDFFSSHGYEVFTFAEPEICPVYRERGGACAMGHPCADVIVSAINFPRMNALALLREQSLKGCRLPGRNKALISGYADAKDQKELAALGCAVFHIPIDFSGLSSWLDQCEQRVPLSEPLSERRKDARRPCDQEITCRLGGNGETAIGTAVNMSASGLCLKIKARLFVGQLIKYKTGTNEDWRIARVVWVSGNDDGISLAGLFCD